MKVWVTKYALTQGIQTYETGVTVVGHHMVKIRIPGTFDEFFHKGEWFESEEEAIAKATEMRDAKIASIRKKLFALKALTEFEVTKIQ